MYKIDCGDEIMKDYFRDLLVENIDEAKVILTGVPFDKNASIGKGASKAPQVMRELSASEPALSMDGDDISACKIYDTGDVTYEGEDDVTYFAKVSKHLDQTLNTNKFNLVVGGDHSIAIASEFSFLNYAKKHNKKPLIIHIDAHPDICDVYEGSKYSHACPIRRAIDNGYPTKDIILIGIRGFEKQEVEYFALHPEIKMFNVNFIHNNGIEPIFKYLKEKINDEYMVYLSYDIDANDPSFAPGTGTPEAFGVNSLDIMKILCFIVRNFNVPMMDIVEIAPPLDVNDITTWLGIKDLYEVFKQLLLKE